MLDPSRLRLVRTYFPVTEQGTFLNHAATSPCSIATVKRIQACAEEMKEPLGKHFYEALGVFEETRRYLAELIGAHPGELAFAQNTSSALSLVAESVRFQPGDRVLVPSNEFTSNIFAWQNLKRKGVEFTFFDVVKDEPITETLARLDLKGVKLISISSVSYETGRRYEIQEFTRFCRDRGIYSCLDAIQEIGAVPVDVHDSGADFVVGGAQKWLLGPIGCGFLYVRRERWSEIDVPLAGWTSVKYPENFNVKQLDFAEEMTRFEPGLPNLLSIAGLNESLRELKEIGWDEVYAGIAEKTAYLRAALRDAGLELLTGERDLTAGIVSFRLPRGSEGRVWTEILHEKDITITIRDNYARVSPHFYTEFEELDRLISVFAPGSSERRSAQSRPRVSEKKPEPAAKGAHALVTGANGILGRRISESLAARGYSLTLLGRDGPALDALRDGLKPMLAPGATAISAVVDLADLAALEHWIADEVSHGARYSALIQCAGAIEVEPLVELDPTRFSQMLQVNTVAPMALMRAFARELKSENPIGILNIVSSSGRCGYPLLSGYGASSGALWTLSEALAREVQGEGFHVTTFVAPAMHSRMQKKIGRVALRYFKMGGVFDYAHPDQVAERALEAFFAGKSLLIDPGNRLKTVVNALLPGIISGKIGRVWRK